MVLAEDFYLSFFSQFLSYHRRSLLMLVLSDGTGRFWDRRRFTARNSGYRVFISRRGLGALSVWVIDLFILSRRGVINQFTSSENSIASFSSFCGFCSQIWCGESLFCGGGGTDEKKNLEYL